MDPQLELDLDPHFEPQQRARSNTWPLPRPENYAEIKEADVVEGICPVDLNGDSVKNPDSSSAPKKNSSRRNAWGNMSYADLITQAIQSSPDNRLTLSQIYDWMVQNVPYFKDKGDSNSSAGWKNSIRHNLSLHNRFVRVQNEGTGKSSWWMINPDAKPGKSARRRATSMETSKYEKKRGRVKKKVEALRAGLTTTPSPSSSVSEGLDMFPESPQIIHPHFQLSPGDFRPRASSNASSIGGRLSPIPAVGPESELQEGAWSPDYPPSLYHPGMPAPSSQRYNADQLVDNIAESMKIRENGYLGSVLSQNGYNMCHPVLGGNPYASAPTYQAPSADYRMPPPPPHPSLNRSPQMTPAPPPYGLTALQGLSPSYGNDMANGYGSLPQPVACSSSSTSSSTDSCNLLRAALAQGSNNSPGSPENPTPSQMMSQLMGALNNNGPMPNDLDLNLDSLQGGFECNVDEVIKHELSMDGTLDFNFSAHQQQQQQQLQQHQHHQPQPAMPSSNEFLFAPTTSSLLAAAGDRAPPSSQSICSLAMGVPGRSWVR